MITQKIIARTDSLKLDKIISRYGEDSMRQVVFIIARPDPESEELIPITIPEDAVGSFRILKPSGNFVIVPMSKSVLATGETAFDVVLPASANTSKGSGYYDIRITSETDKYYYTAQGDFIIDDNIISDEVLEDVSEVNGLIFPDDFLTVEDHVAYIDDDTISTDSTWSSNKINEEIEAHAGGDVSKTVSGNPVTFTDGADAPLVKCVTQIAGYQQGSGTPSPDNVRPIVAYTEGEIEVRGKNLLKNNKYLSGNTLYLGENAKNTFSTKLKAGTYKLSYQYNGSGTPSAYYQTYNGGGNISISDNTITVDFDCIIRIWLYKSGIQSSEVTDFQLELGTSATAYEPYKDTTHTTTYPSVIFRGSEDVVNGSVEAEKIKIQSDGTGFLIANNGVLYNDSNILTGISFVVEDLIQTITDKYDFYGIITGTAILAGKEGKFALQIIGNVIRIAIYDSRFTTAEDFRTYLANNPLEIVYKLATTTSSVTPTNLPIKSLSGYTHIESTTGDMEVEYITQRFQPLIDSIKQL